MQVPRRTGSPRETTCVHVVRREVSSSDSTGIALQHTTTPTSRPPSITIARPRIFRPAIHETLPQRQQFVLIGRDDL
jgi:hypothetical protein